MSVRVGEEHTVSVTVYLIKPLFFEGGGANILSIKSNNIIHNIISVTICNNQVAHYNY